MFRTKLHPDGVTGAGGNLFINPTMNNRVQLKAQSHADGPDTQIFEFNNGDGSLSAGNTSLSNEQKIKNFAGDIQGGQLGKLINELNNNNNLNANTRIYTGGDMLVVINDSQIAGTKGSFGGGDTVKVFDQNGELIFEGTVGNDEVDYARGDTKLDRAPGTGSGDRDQAIMKFIYDKCHEGAQTGMIEGKMSTWSSMG